MLTIGIVLSVFVFPLSLILHYMMRVTEEEHYDISKLRVDTLYKRAKEKREIIS